MQFWKLNTRESYWILSSFKLSPAPPLLTPVSTSRYRYLVSQDGLHLSPKCPRLASVLLVQCKEQMNWISTRRKKPTVPAGALGCLLVGADKHFPIFHIIREKTRVAARTQESSLCEFVVNFHLEGNKNNSSQISPEKGLSSWYGQYLLSKETDPYCCYAFILMPLLT